MWPRDDPRRRAGARSGEFGEHHGVRIGRSRPRTAERERDLGRGANRGQRGRAHAGPSRAARLSRGAPRHRPRRRRGGAARRWRAARGGRLRHEGFDRGHARPRPQRGTASRGGDLGLLRPRGDCQVAERPARDRRAATRPAGRRRGRPGRTDRRSCGGGLSGDAEGEGEPAGPTRPHGAPLHGAKRHSSPGRPAVLRRDLRAPRGRDRRRRVRRTAPSRQRRGRHRPQRRARRRVVRAQPSRRPRPRSRGCAGVATGLLGRIAERGRRRRSPGLGPARQSRTHSSDDRPPGRSDRGACAGQGRVDGRGDLRRDRDRGHELRCRRPSPGSPQ